MKTRWSIGMALVALVTALPAGAAQAAAAERPSPAGHKVRCVYVPTPDNPAAKPVRPPRPKARNRGTVRVTLQTNFGDIAVVMDRRNAPCAVHSFISLARQRFFHRTQCWRLTNSPRLGVLQCGDIYRAEEGGPGYKFDDELTGREIYPRGTVAMGNWGPDTNGSQFFIVHSRANIPPAYTVLGKVVRGMRVLDAIVAAGIIPGPDGKPDGLPAKPVKIHRVLTHG